MARQKTPLAGIKTLPSFSELGVPEDYIDRELPSLGISSVEDFIGLVYHLPEAVRAATDTPIEILEELSSEALERLVPPENLDLLEPVARLETPFGVAPPETEYEQPGTEEAARSFEALEAEIVLPESTPLSASLLDGCAPGFRNQGNRRTCTAFAAAGVLEYLLCRARGQQVDLSEQYLYWVMAQNGVLLPDETAHIADVFPLAQANGVCRETFWRYDPNHRPGDATHGNPPNRQDCDRDASLHMFDSVHSLADPRDIVGLRRVVASGHPVAVEIPLFETYWIESLYYFGQITLPPAGAGIVNRHAVVLMGYETSLDPALDLFQIRNSATEWGRSSPLGAGRGTILSSYLAQFAESAWSGTV